MTEAERLKQTLMKKRLFIHAGETEREMYRRVAVCVSGGILTEGASTIDEVDETDQKFLEEDFFRLLESGEFVPNSPCLMNSGREGKQRQLAACFVIPVEDSVEGIFEAVKRGAIVHQTGGGTGYSFTGLRPHGDRVLSSSGQASGPVDFMRMFDTATDCIKQGGKRRGANMGVLWVHHPDIMDFIQAKKDHGLFNNFNLSVGISDEFMRAVASNREYGLINPRSGQVVRTLAARPVFDTIAKLAWESGEPGVLFLDQINRAHPLDFEKVGFVEATNPCGEVPLLPNESCILGSLVLSRFVVDGSFSFEELRKAVWTSTSFLDCTVGASQYPFEDIREATLNTRKIGLGVMGFADALVLLGIDYRSVDAVAFAEDVMHTIQEEARARSIALGRSWGSFPYREHLKTPVEHLRNAVQTTIAPTGSISALAQCSSGIEPFFARQYRKFMLDEQWELEPTILAQDIDPALVVTALEVPVGQHLAIQAAFQRSTGNAVSKTITLPQETTVEEIQDIYMKAWELSLKGVTVYRDRCREDQAVTLGPAVKKEGCPEIEIFNRDETPVLTGRSWQEKTACGNLYVIVNRDETGRVVEVFVSMGKGGGCRSSETEGLGRIISLALAHGTPLAAVVKQLDGIGCGKMRHYEGQVILSCADGVAKALRKELAADEAGQEGSALPKEPGCESCA